ncbi:hypothetical protein KUCAC02_001164 [Chaenocephalus aceratus]|uniref:Uncharacterized protein n=1 Tax=Chaenocephalus aceratus TaxID=36190 RepID=A0ACB9XX49_CHAAC|nr:hypothetical protein KUCAC02_001164 [Chaenocephalus aceratus]
MYPEQPRPGPAPQRRADSPPGGTWSTGLLQGLLQSARPPPFCSLLPRVHAADVAAAQPAQMPSSSSSSTSPPPIPSPSAMWSNMDGPELTETGWDRIKDLFQMELEVDLLSPCSAKHMYPEELTSVIKSGVVGALAGMLYGGLPAAHHARQSYIQISQAELYSSRVEAVVSGLSECGSVINSTVEQRWQNSVSTGLSVYRDKNALSHYAAAGAVTGGLFRLNLGLGGLLVGAVIGAVLGAESTLAASCAPPSNPLSPSWTPTPPPSSLFTGPEGLMCIAEGRVLAFCRAHRAKSGSDCVMGNECEVFDVTGHLERLMCANSPGPVRCRLPTGALIVGMQSMAGDNSRDRRRRERRELYDLKLAEWTDRLNVTEELIGDLNVGSQAEEANEDMQRIQELLSLPKNEDVTQESPSQ